MSDTKQPTLQRQLLNKSIEAYTLSLEVINSLTRVYRIETFCYLLCNAWELLLKAKIIHEAGGDAVVYYKVVSGPARRSLSLRDCLAKVFSSEREPMRRNLERVADLRDESTHLIITEVPHNTLCVLQACVLNYHRMLGCWFNESLSQRVTLGMMSIVFDHDPIAYQADSAAFRDKVGPDAADFLAHLDNTIQHDLDDLGYSDSFAIQIEYKLVIVKKPEEADARVLLSESGQPLKAVHKPKDSAITHPYRQKEVMVELNRTLAPFGMTVNSRDVQAITRVHGVPARNEFYFIGKLTPQMPQYSDAFVSWVEARCRSDPEFLTKTRMKYSQQNRHKTKSA